MHLLGLDDDFADAGVGEFGLHNSVMAIGNTFLEIVAPARDDTTAERLLDRRGGDGGYMVLVQVKDIDLFRRQVEDLGIRKIWEIDREDVRAFHVHPKDIGAAIVSFDEMIPPEEWVWGGPDWRSRRARHVSTITAVDIQGSDPVSLAGRWTQALGGECYAAGEGFVISLDEGQVNVMSARDGRGDGVCAVEFDARDKQAIQNAARDLGLEFSGNEVEICGTRFRFRNW